ncbi:MAG: hypothetical protein WC045_01675 [Patescibacteria group bacterium]
MEKYLFVNKPIGQTPLEAIKALQSTRPDLADVKIGYAGRLDPMAHGLLLLLLGDENKHQKGYFGLRKTYEVTLLLGFETDTGDILGLVKNDYQLDQECSIDDTTLAQVLAGYCGVFTQTYPLYSSKPVSGKPLFAWAREEKVSEIEVPTKEVEIYSIELIAKEQIAKKDLVKLMNERTDLVTGDFRQPEVQERWRDKLSLIDNDYRFETITIRVDCSSGTYMRSLAERIGNDLGSGALALDIYRTKIGDHTL